MFFGSNIFKVIIRVSWQQAQKNKAVFNEFFYILLLGHPVYLVHQLLRIAHIRQNALKVNIM